MNRPAYLDEIEALWRCGEIEEIVRRCQGKLDELNQQEGEKYPESAELHELLGRAYYDMEEHFAAVSEYEKALAIHRSHHQLPTANEVRCLDLTGRNYEWTGRPAEAEEKLAEALTLLDHLPENEQEGRGFVLIDLAVLHLHLKELEQAEELLLRAIKPHLKYFGYDSPHLAWVYYHLSIVYESQGRHFAADRTMRKAIRIRMMTSYDDDAYFGWMVSNRGTLYKRRGQILEARKMQEQAVSILERTRKPGHPMLEKVRGRLARLEEKIRREGIGD